MKDHKEGHNCQTNKIYWKPNISQVEVSVIYHLQKKALKSIKAKQIVV